MQRACARGVLGLVGCLAFGLAVGSASALATTTTYTAPGCGNTVPANLFTVPAGVTSVTITATGSAGQTTVFQPGVGTGDVVSGTLSGLSSGQILDVCVDSGGGAPAGGPASGGAGGGASGVALGADFSTPVLIAAGGGGSGGGQGSGFGGMAGLPSGRTGENTLFTGGGGGGTQSTFGAGGAGPLGAAGANGSPSSSAGPGAGGAGASDSGGGGGGGGGAGYFGGGGGGSNANAGSGGAGGGGGSDFCASSLTGATLSGCTVTTLNFNFGTASVAISYTAQTPTSTSLSSSPNPSLAGQAVTYTATVSPVPDGGTVAFIDDGSPISGCTAQAVSSTGTAICQVTYTAAGSHTIQAAYSGDQSFASSSSSILTQQVIDHDLALEVPAAITADATGPSGATVSYTPPSASDEDGETPAVSCTSAPGSTFAIGTTTVTCIAIDSDDSNSPVTATFTVTVKGAAQQLSDLKAEVQGVGPGSSLSDKVAQAQSELASGDIGDTCGTLGAFINEVNAQTGKSIPPAQAAQLIADAKRIQAVIGC